MTLQSTPIVTAILFVTCTSIVMTTGFAASADETPEPPAINVAIWLGNYEGDAVTDADVTVGGKSAVIEDADERAYRVSVARASASDAAQTISVNVKHSKYRDVERRLQIGARQENASLALTLFRPGQPFVVEGGVRGDVPVDYDKSSILLHLEHERGQDPQTANDIAAVLADEYDLEVIRRYEDPSRTGESRPGDADPKGWQFAVRRADGKALSSTNSKLLAKLRNDERVSFGGPLFTKRSSDWPLGLDRKINVRFEPDVDGEDALELLASHGFSNVRERSHAGSRHTRIEIVLDENVGWGAVKSATEIRQLAGVASVSNAIFALERAE